MLAVCFWCNRPSAQHDVVSSAGVFGGGIVCTRFFSKDLALIPDASKQFNKDPVLFRLLNSFSWMIWSCETCTKRLGFIKAEKRNSVRIFVPFSTVCRVNTEAGSNHQALTSVSRLLCLTGETYTYTHTINLSLSQHLLIRICTLRPCPHINDLFLLLFSWNPSPHPHTDIMN